MTSVLDRLRAALATHDLVEIERRGFAPQDRRTHGYPLAIGENLVLLSVLSDRIDLDGYEVLILGDITSCHAEFPRKAFYLKALELKGESPTTPADLNLASIWALLDSAQRQFPLLVIHRERLAPGECDIGRLKLTSDDAFAIHYIDPDARWTDDRGHYNYTDVTRVGFGGEYEATLALVAGVAV